MAERVRAGLFEQRAGVCRVLVMLSFPPISVVGSVHTTPELSGLGWGHKNVLS